MSRLLPAVAIAALFASSGAMAQTTPPTATPGSTHTAPSTQAPAAKSVAPADKMAPGHATAPTLTETQAKAWLDKTIYSSDDKNVGEVATITRDASGRVTGMQADVGGFLGLGSSRVKLTPSQFRLAGDRVILNITADQVKQLPKVQ